jgi:hypothetical protein
MTKIPRFCDFAHLAADATLINVVGGSVGIAFRSFAVELSTRVTDPIWILLLEDRIVVFAVLVPVYWTGRVALTCLT